MENKETAPKESKSPNLNSITVPIAIVVAGLAIAGAVYFSNTKNANTAPAGVAAVDANAPVALDQVTKDDHINGNLNAKVLIVEYTDLECPWCKVFHATMTQVSDNYSKDDVAWVIRDFPIAELHPKAPNEAQASECAAKLGGNSKFWDFVNNVFKITPSNNGLDPAELPTIAKNIGLDVNAFNSCLSSGETKSIVDADIASGQKTGQIPTPTSYVVVNNKVIATIKGAQSYDYVKAIIDKALGK